MRKNLASALYYPGAEFDLKKSFHKLLPTKRAMYTLKVDIVSIMAAF